MKRMTALLIILAIVFPLRACSVKEEMSQDQVCFYYCHTKFSYDGTAGSVISPETREAAGHRNDLSYLLSLYLRGPEDPAFTSPFPSGVTLVDVLQDGNTLHITLNNKFADLSGLDLAIACACLTKTCLGLGDIDSVCIYAEDALLNGEHFIEMNADSLLLLDDSAELETEG